jgi:TRAP-type C4-dicarboxylate transport system substrate-binding protein
VKKKLVAAIVMAVLCIGAFGAVALAKDKVITLRLSDHDVCGGLKGKIGTFWINEIEKQTEGKVKIKAYWGGTLFNAEEEVKALSDGVVDIAAIYPDFYPKQLPLFGAFWLFPKGPENWENIRWIYKESIKRIPEFSRELEKTGMKVLLMENGLPMCFMARYPITSLKDLKGKKWRAGDRWNLKLLENQGTVAISIPWGDCYMALETGTVDGIVSNYDGMHRQKFDEPAKNILTGKAIGWSQPMFYCINQKKWDSIPEDIQEDILRATEITEKAFADMYNSEFDRIVEAEKNAGCTVNFYSSEDVDSWADEECLQGLREIFCSELTKDGIADPEAMVKELKDIINEGIAKEN